ncbi:MAG TPA: N-acetyl-alpha-D-glucosaminyl L-malate synthase BshA [Verrucomicrobiae bacterium]|nr:N-acetyl-alpha-D-glucosaminyl L-malate synthase BshA [Verrucomicrobiae bacterium]
MELRPLKIGITCYPTVGGSGVLATSLGEDLARRGHEVHFISYKKPFRMPENEPRIHFHPVVINGYELFKYPDYTLPLSVRMAEVSRQHRLDILHVHYAVPHATAALLACAMLTPDHRPSVITTMHGTDTTLLGNDPGYRPAIYHALEHSNAVTTVSNFLQAETRRVLGFNGPIEVIHNFYTPRLPQKNREEVRRELGLDDETLIFHSSNLRGVKRIDLLLETAARLRNRADWKLLILAGGTFEPYAKEVQRLKLEDRVIVRERVNEIEDYVQAADLGLITSDTESFCLSILEAMCFACPSVATKVGGIPEVIEDGVTGLLSPPGDAVALASNVETLLSDATRRGELGLAAKARAQRRFSAEVIVPQYEALYRRTCEM